MSIQLEDKHLHIWIVMWEYLPIQLQIHFLQIRSQTSPTTKYSWNGTCICKQEQLNIQEKPNVEYLQYQFTSIFFHSKSLCVSVILLYKNINSVLVLGEMK